MHVVSQGAKQGSYAGRQQAGSTAAGRQAAIPVRQRLLSVARKCVKELIKHSLLLAVVAVCCQCHGYLVHILLHKIRSQEQAISAGSLHAPRFGKAPAHCRRQY